jgi:hypothetical protein
MRNDSAPSAMPVAASTVFGRARGGFLKPAIPAMTARIETMPKRYNGTESSPRTNAPTA